MSDLREKIARAIGYGREGGPLHLETLEVADAILDIPEIKLALAYMKAIDEAHPIFHEIREMVERETT